MSAFTVRNLAGGLAMVLIGAFGPGISAAATPSGALHSSSAAATGAQPAEWLQHDLIVKLDHLPQRYSCDELWYRFHDLLLALGARPDVSILAYACEPSLGIDARSPRVHLKFYLPQPLAPSQAKWSDTTVQSQRVRIEPGMGTWKAGDCGLLRQIKGTLLPAIGAKVLDFRLACRAPPKSKPPFELTVSTLMPVTGSRTALAPPANGRDIRTARADGAVASHH